jgi:predicted O-methyltransferase YrrM
MNAVLERVYETGFVEDGEGKRVRAFPSSVSFESGALLYDVVRGKKLRRTLEVGMAYGVSTLFICQAHADGGGGSHIAIDPFQGERYHHLGLLNLRRAGLEGLARLYESPSHEVLPRLLAEGERIDFAFIDGAHFFDFALVDFFYVDRMLRVGGFVAFDDLWMPAVRGVVSYILRNRAYRLVNPPLREKQPLWGQVKRVGRRLAQNPLSLDWRVRLIPRNICVLEKRGEDERPWGFHRAF